MKHDVLLQSNKFFVDKNLRDNYFKKFDEARKNLSIIEHVKKTNDETRLAQMVHLE